MSTATEATIDAGLALRIVDIDGKVKELEAAQAALKEERAGLESTLIEQFSHAGVNSIKAAGRSVSLRRDIYAKTLDPARICDVLIEAGFGEIIETKPQSQRLSALLREIDRGDIPRPDSFEGVVDVSERFSIRVTAK